MGYCKLSESVVWAEPGTVVLGASPRSPVWASATDTFLVPNSTTGAILTTPTIASWFSVSTFGAEYMDFEFNSNLIAAGLLTAASTTKTYLYAFGKMTQSGDALFDTPGAVLQAPGSAITQTATEGSYLWSIFDTSDSCTQCAYSSGGQSAKVGLFRVATIAAGDVNTWRVRIGRKNSVVAGVTYPYEHLIMNGLTKVWFAFGINQTLTGGVATTYAKAELRLLLGRETISLGPG